MIADALAILSLLLVATWAVLLVRAERLKPRTPTAGGENLGIRVRLVLGVCPPAVLVLMSAAQLDWSIYRAAPYVITAGVVSYVLILGLPQVVGRHVSLAVPICAWTLTCLGAVTAERLYPGTGVDQARWAVLAIFSFGAAAAGACRWKTTPQQSIGAVVAAMGCAALAAPLVPGVGTTVNGAPGWISLGPVMGQPGDIARIAIVAGMGTMYFAAGPQIRAGRIRPIISASWPLAVAVLIGGLSNDLGPVLVVVGATVIMLVLTGPPIRVVLIMTSCLAVVTVGMFVAVAKLRERLDQMLHPVTADGLLQNTGFALRAIANGGWFGTGFNHGNPHAVANVDNDFVLAGIGEERGMIALVVVITLFGAMTAGTWASAQRAISGGPRLVAAGLASALTVQSLYVVCAAANLLPVTGMVVPFLSRGGSSLVGMWVLLGIVVGIGAHRGTEVQGASGAQLESKITAAKSAAGIAWIIVGIVILASPVVRPIAPAEYTATSQKGNLVLRDGTVVVHASNSTNGDDDPMRQLSDAVPEDERHIFQYVDTATGFDACLAHWSDSVVLRHGCRPETVVSTIVPQVQDAARRGFAAGLSGDAVVLDVETGNILGLFSSPSTGPTEAGTFSAVTTASSPGSTFKVIVAAAALAQGVDVNTPIRSSYTPPGGVGVVHNAGGVTGGGTVETALAESSNTAFAEIATRTGFEAIASMATSLSSPTPAERNTVTGPPISTGGTAGSGADALARTGFGQQDVRATPLNMALAAGMIATNGALPAPRLQAGICDGSSFIPSPVHIPEATLDSSTTDPILEGMTVAVESGHGGALSETRFPVAAKTGTADNGTGDTYDGWVIALSPADHPRVAVAVRVWAGADGASRTGAGDATPIASAVLLAANDFIRDDVANPCSR